MTMLQGQPHSGSIVAALRLQQDRPRLVETVKDPAQSVPSAQVLRRVMDGLVAALYPNRLGRRETKGNRSADDTALLDYFVGHTLGLCFLRLQDLLAHELRWQQPALAEARRGMDVKAQSLQKIVSFANRLPVLRAKVDHDVKTAFDGDLAATSLEEVLVCYPGLRAIIDHRIAHELHTLGVPILARRIAELSYSDTGVDIDPGAVIGDHFSIDHGTGVVIGRTAIIGNHVRLHQAVTLGAKHHPLDHHGHGVKGQPRHPIIEDDVIIYAGATILGRVTIGKGSTIGGHVWLTRSVPPGSVIPQVQARHEKFVDGAGI
jgi:serine O-acetyltransferase